MAQKVQVILVDDVDGGTAVESVTFALDGVSYEIDLSKENAAQLREALAPWVGYARRVGGRPGRARRKGGSGSSAAVREWARAQGRTVSERGRISAEIKAAYDAAH